MLDKYYQVSKSGEEATIWKGDICYCYNMKALAKFPKSYGGEIDNALWNDPPSLVGRLWGVIEQFDEVLMKKPYMLPQTEGIFNA